MFDQNLQESEKFQEVQKNPFPFVISPYFYIFFFDLLLFFLFVSDLFSCYLLFFSSNNLKELTHVFHSRFHCSLGFLVFFAVSFFSLDNFFEKKVFFFLFHLLFFSIPFFLSSSFFTENNHS